MTKVGKPSTPTAGTARSPGKGTPLVVLATLAGGSVLGYFIGQLAFLYQHPIHWGLGIVGGAVGWLTGKLIYRLRGEQDII